MTHTTELADRLLTVVKEHLAAEAARDIEWTLRTVTDDCRYDFPLQGLTIIGRENLRQYYEVLFKSRPGKSAGSHIQHYWISGEDTVIAECEIRYEGVENSQPAVLIGVFGVRDGALSSERVYVTAHQDWVEKWRRDHE